MENENSVQANHIEYIFVPKDVNLCIANQLLGLNETSTVIEKDGREYLKVLKDAYLGIRDQISHHVEQLTASETLAEMTLAEMIGALRDAGFVICPADPTDNSDA